jgi:hypothetical protein
MLCHERKRAKKVEIRFRFSLDIILRGVFCMDLYVDDERSKITKRIDTAVERATVNSIQIDGSDYNGILPG